MRVICCAVVGLLLMCRPTVADEAFELANLRKQVESLSQQVTTLKAELRDVEKERDSLREELGKLNTEDSTPIKGKTVVAPLGMVWDGKMTTGTRTQSAKMSVVDRDHDKGTATLKIEIETGAVWEFDGEFKGRDGKDFKLLTTRRIKASDGVVDPPPVGGTTGKGAVNGKTLSFQYNWAAGNINHRFLGTSK